MLETKRNNVLVNMFFDNTSILKYIKDTKRRACADDSSLDKNYGFTGTHTFEEAVEKLKYGDEELFQRVRKKVKEINVEKLLGNVKNKRQGFSDIVGFQANVPAYLTNNPLSMINVTPKRENQRVLNLFLTQTVHCGINKEKVEKVGSVYLATIDILEKMGYRCNLYLGYSIKQGSPKQINNLYMVNRIKTDREPLNIKKMVFPLCHVGMFRRFGFAWIERCNIDLESFSDGDYDITHRGYGQPITDTKKIQKDLKEHTGIDFIVWAYQSGSNVNVEDVLKSLKEKGIEIDIEL